MIPVAVDAVQYAEFMAGEIQDERDLADMAEIQRRWFNRITPPGFSWVQPMLPSVAPFDADGFTESFLDGLLGEDRNSVAVYPLSLALDPKTRETLVHDADGKLIAALPSDGVSRDWPEDADPARVVLQLDLLPSEDVEPYLYVEGRIAESTKPVKSAGMVLRSLGAGEFGFAGAHRLTNGQMRLTVTNGTDVAEIYSYTVWHTSTVVVTVWTNEYDEVITSTNFVWDPVSPPYAGIESAWACQTTNLVLSGGVGTWDDADVSTNARVRFYAAAKRIDSDGDGLTDGMEIFLHRTDPGVADTDGDGWSDAEELAEETDPLDRFSAPRLARGVVINEVLYDDGTAEQRGEWIELYSAGRYPVNLDGFQIEVGNGDFDPVYALSNVWLHAGQALLLGGSEVAGRDQGPDAGFGMPNRGYSGPTAAVRLVATNEGLRVVDCLMYGGNVNNFNSDGLDTTGWISETAYYAGAGSSLYRRYPGHDTDQAGDWHWTNGPTPQNTNFVFDTDGDELTDEQEWTGSLNNGVPTNPYDPDSDGDGLDDHAECVTHGTDPNAWATDGDLFPWPPASGGVTNWPGSDSYEIAYDWNPLVADQNSNGIPDSWEMAFPGTNIYGHADGDGVTNLTELLQNSNPFDVASSNAQPYVLRFESSIGEWTNGQWQDVGLNGWVRACFEQITTNVDVCLWIVEGSNSEPFTATWDGVADGTVTMVDDQHALASATLLTGSRPSLLVKDNGAHPNYTNHLGGEYKIDVLKVDLDVYDGQGGAEVDDNVEESIGAFTVANLNDTDGDGTIDRDDSNVTATANGRNEVDLMQLVVRKPEPDVGDNVILRVVSGDVKLWENATKGTEITLSSSEAEFSTTDLPKMLWVEARATSANLRDIELEMEYKGCFDRVKATGIWAQKLSFRNTGNTLSDDADGTGINDTFADPDLFDLKLGIVNTASIRRNNDELGFTVLPSGVGSESKVRFDVTRQKENMAWHLDSTVWTEFAGVGFPDSFPTKDEEPNDDPPGTIDEDNMPLNDHIYSIDTPGLGFPFTLHDRFVIRYNFREFVRVKVDGSSFDDETVVDGSRCSDKVAWRAKLDLIDDSTLLWGRNPTGENEIEEGHESLLPPPFP